MSAVAFFLRYTLTIFSVILILLFLYTSSLYKTGRVKKNKSFDLTTFEHPLLFFLRYTQTIFSVILILLYLYIIGSLYKTERVKKTKDFDLAIF